MRIWIVTIGEPLPKREAKDRLHRSGVLAHYLLDRGHEVVWWGSAFDHFSKQHHFEKDAVLTPEERFKVVLFEGGGYKSNVSFRRMRDHKRLADKFAAAIRNGDKKPDVIVSSFPTIELCREAVQYGRDYSV